MDFAFDDTQLAVRELAAQILGDLSTPVRLAELEADPARPPIDTALWGQLAESGLLGIALPEALGGGGRGFLDLALVLTEVGRRTARVPYLTHVVGALALADHGLGDLAAKAATGEIVVTLALSEPGTTADAPLTRATAAGDAWTLTGTKPQVIAGTVADVFVVSARIGNDGDTGEVGLFAVDAGAAGASVDAQATILGFDEGLLHLDGAPATLLAQGGAALEGVLQRATAGLCATTVGVCEEALRLTAEYTKTREQFGRPIAGFQAVGQRAADSYIDTQAVRLTALQAAWRLDAGIDAHREIAMAKFWVADGAQRVVHAAQHLHGGMGVDRDYPLHRYFLAAKHLELTLGGATAQLLDLGRSLAAEPV